ncbi:MULTISPECIES: Stk1 family PASTA domain-containing Ser/Thr kinase [Actinokineospora]|uniref:non-specific serine/threonine protein kinase n=1 Tax=Actinokineospora fastidiosa TaxID=1816 RepID=A0A918G4A6_9PSEU|nr:MULTISPECIES: Stk1 family PASTA domain-containing Ser/Thr kinase [Actinokineospora]UVS76353.1 Serine/threonine-protein kinase PknB [Actinokineospora sp. UTMC 2448]GGS18829.1 serine/threonine protein kinase [Actinokineospora fastidiosa]
MTTPRLLSNRYEIGETLGYGGMSEVHRGRDVRLGREVAVKVLRADLARDPQFQERFRREAQNAAALNHPAIVAVYDTGETLTEQGPLPYIVMEYVDGRTLRDIVKTEGPLSGQRAMEIMADVCAALDFSHRHGIVHRDVKPANVMINRSGAVKVMDFGIARAVADGQAAVTQTAAVIGTAQYLSPEQARGEAVDARSDVYATGCVLFELLTGEPPFTGDSPVAVAYQHVREDPRPPSQLNPRVSPQLDAIVLKAMSKGAANRYQSAAEMRTDIVRVLSGQRPSAPMVMTEDDRTAVLGAGRPMPTSGGGRHRPEALVDDYDDYYDDEDERRRKQRKTWAVVLAALLVAALVGLLFWLLNQEDAPTTPQTVAVPDVVSQLEADARRQLEAAGLKVERVEVKCEQTADGQPGECGANDIGRVIGTTPAAGTEVSPGDTVTYRVGVKPGKVAVPDVIGKTQEEATTALEEAKLQVSPTVAEEEVDDESKVGKVVKTNPAANQQVDVGTSVTLTIGKAKAKVSVPNVIGQDYETAARNLKEAGLEPQRRDVSSDQPAGTVVNQAPKDGEVAPGFTVVLDVSNGDQVDQPLEMPDLSGMTVDEAEQALRGGGWTGRFNVNKVRDTCDEEEIGKIFNQSPNPGEEIDKDRTIQVFVHEEQQFGCLPGGGNGN